MKKNKFISLILCSLLLLGILESCSSQKESSKTSNKYNKITTVENAKGCLKGVSLKVGTSGLFPPFTYYDNNNKLIGYDLDLIAALQDYLGFDIDGGIQAMDYSALSASVANNKLDLVCGALCATDERKKVMNFSTAYYKVNQYVMINKEKSPSGITGVDDLKTGNYKVAVEKGTPSHLYAQKYIPEDKIVVFDTITTAYVSLEDGKVDALIQEGPAVFYYLQTESNTKLDSVGDGFNEYNLHYGAAISFDATDKYNLQKIVNLALKGLEKDGTIDKIKSTWGI